MPTILKFFKNGELLPDAEISGIRGEVYPGMCVCGGKGRGWGGGLVGVSRCTRVFYVNKNGGNGFNPGTLNPNPKPQTLNPNPDMCVYRYTHTQP
jgi:hypothetical protein